ncbi:MAG: cupin domain-containing protein [Acetobacteraceae bacterium]|nr:cupin domain-containing protein [Acetobacteraceae bacterium]
MSETINEHDVLNHVSLPGAGRTEAVLGTHATYKAEASDTAGQLVCAEITVPPGQGIPPHRHSQEDEAFYVLSGRVVIEGDDCDDGGVALSAGGFFYGPRGRIHGFRCDGDEAAKLLVLISPGTGIGAMFTELAELTREQRDGVDPARVAAICSNYGVAFAGPRR